MEGFVALVRAAVNCGDVETALRMVEPENVPVVYRDQLAVAQLRRDVKQLRAHLADESLYQERYRSEPEVRPAPGYHRSKLRAQVALQWAQEAPKEGPPLMCLSVGPHSAEIERDMLLANPRIHFTLREFALSGVEDLIREFPERVTRTDPSSADPVGQGKFTFILLLEVLEHLPSAGAALLDAHRALVPDGTLLISVPNPLIWQEAIWERTMALGWTQHVRAFSDQTLFAALNKTGFRTLFLVEAGDGTFVAAAQRSSSPPVDHRVNVRVSMTDEIMQRVQTRANVLREAGFLTAAYLPALLSPGGQSIFRARGDVLLPSEATFDPEDARALSETDYFTLPAAAIRHRQAARAVLGASE